MKSSSRGAGISATELVEQAVHLLRGAPVGLHAIYLIGVLPFLLAFLYFWADMSHGAFAHDHIATGAMVMAVLFLWMKCCQVVYADSLRARLTGRISGQWTLRRVVRLFTMQLAFQPSGLFLIPLAAAILLPLGWTYSFYQNVTVLGGETGSFGETFRFAARQASHRQGQCNTILAILSVFAFFVWLNVMIAMAALPGLMKTLLGIDSAFTRAGYLSIFNTTYLACSFVLTMLFVDPLFKAAYVLRCFYGQSVQTGEDLKAELGRVRAPATGAFAALAMVAILSFAQPLPAAVESIPATPSSAVSSGDLNDSINQVLQQREFAWRMSREAVDESAVQRSWLGRVCQELVDQVSSLFKSAATDVGKFFKWIGEHWLRGKTSAPSSGWGSGMLDSLRIILLILIIAIAAVLGFLIVRMWSRRRKPDVVLAEAIHARPDLNDENIVANQLPEEGWLSMAADMIQQGNFRLALRAYYLASLAHLGARELIAIAIFKSNREYENELRRRARALPVVQSAFSQNVAAFDRAWYGLHEVTREALQEFQSNLERIRTC